MTSPTVGDNAQRWLEVLHQIANSNKGVDGHLTIMAFTTGWKAMFGTPELSDDGRAELWQMPIWPTLEKALEIVYQDALSEVEYRDSDAALHDQSVSGNAQLFEQIKAMAFGTASDWNATDGDDLEPSQLLDDWRAAGERLATDDDDLEPELTEAQLAEIARTWPRAVKDALSRYVGRTMTEAGINKISRLDVLYRLAVLIGEIDE